MSKVSIANEQSDITISRKLARSIATQIMDYTRFPTAEIIFTDEISGGPSNIRNMFNKNQGDPLRTSYRDYIFISYKDTFTEEDITRRAYNVQRSKPIFLDGYVGMSVCPEYAESELTLTLKFRCNSLARLNGWTNALRLSDGLQALNMTFDLRYD